LNVGVPGTRSKNESNSILLGEASIAATRSGYVDFKNIDPSHGKYLLAVGFHVLSIIVPTGTTSPPPFLIRILFVIIIQPS